MAELAALQPCVIGATTVRNRATVTAHITGFARDGLVTPELIAYHSARAEGGVGLIITETGSVHPTYQPRGVQYFRPGALDGLSRLASAVREHGATIFGQLNHGGAQSPNLPDASPAWSASDNVGQMGRVARAMTRAEIAELLESFVTAAALLEQAGYQGCEVHGAHSYLINHFLSPLYNRRDDEYGGSTDGRRRLLVEILSSIRAAVASDFVVGVRLGAEIGVGGLTPDDLADLGSSLQSQGLVDYVGFSLGGRLVESAPLMSAAMDQPAGYELAWNEHPSRSLSVPTIVTGRFRTIEEASAVVASGVADFVGLTRAHLVDPEIVRKTVDGRHFEVRPCIACNECQVTLATTGTVRCTMNAGLPTHSFTEWEDRADTSRRVLVVGGGPAGLEAARVATLRGHQVRLVEATDRLGGVAATVAERVPHTAPIADGLAWLAAELERLGVEVELDRRIDADEITAMAPDAVIVATGAPTDPNPIQFGAPGQSPDVTGRNVLSSLDALMLDGVEAGSHAVVVDDVGDYEAIGVAEHLVGLGAHVTVVTPFATLAPAIDTSFRPVAALSRLNPTGRFVVRTLAHLLQIDDGAVGLLELAGRGECRLPATLVVLSTRRGGDRSLEAALAGRVPTVIAAGDAVAHRNLRAAIADGRQAAMAIC